VSRYVLDTDTFTHYLQNNPSVVSALIRHLSDEVVLSVITVQEVWDGWAAVIARAKTPDQLAAAYDRLTAVLNELRNWPVVSFPAAAVHRYAALRKQKLNVGANDLRIAAIAIESAATVVTHNRRDYQRLPGVVIEDWVV
jgi:tRNA(fMet)-specific endonuclease VapC